MHGWKSADYTVSGNYTGCRVFRYRANNLEIAHVIVAKDGYYATGEERERVRQECATICAFLNQRSWDLMESDGLSETVAQSFPHFQNGERVTIEAVRKIGQEYLAMQTENGPKEIEFADQDGRTRKIVYESGDPLAGISGGWTIPEDADWMIRGVKRAA